MLTVIDRVSKGEMDAEIPNLRWDEFQELSRHFKSMVSELKKSQDKIMRTQQQLIVAAKFAILGQVTAELAHEVRNPLNSMEITLRLLREEVGDAALAPPVSSRRLSASTRRSSGSIRPYGTSWRRGAASS